MRLPHKIVEIKGWRSFDLSAVRQELEALREANVA
jgi:hypothetical protein